MEIDIFKNPPSKSDIAQWRDNAQQEYARKQEDRLSTKVFMYCPIPIVLKSTCPAINGWKWLLQQVLLRCHYPVFLSSPKYKVLMPAK